MPRCLQERQGSPPTITSGLTAAAPRCQAKPKQQPLENYPAPSIALLHIHKLREAVGPGKTGTRMSAHLLSQRQHDHISCPADGSFWTDGEQANQYQDDLLIPFNSRSTHQSNLRCGHPVPEGNGSATSIFIHSRMVPLKDGVTKGRCH